MLRRHGVKVLMKSLRKSDTRVSVKFLNTLDAHLRNVVKEACTACEGKSLNDVGVEVSGSPPKPPIISRTALDKYIADVQGPTKITKTFINTLNRYAVMVCMASLDAVTNQTVSQVDLNVDNRVGRVPVTQRVVDDPIPKPPVREFEVPMMDKGPKESFAVRYSVRIQDMDLQGTYHVFTAYPPNKITRLIENNVKRQFQLLGIHDVPVATIQSIEKQVRSVA